MEKQVWRWLWIGHVIDRDHMIEILPQTGSL
jgi:hypothetical protein